MEKPLTNFLFDVYVKGEKVGQTTTDDRHTFIKEYQTKFPDTPIFDFEFRVVNVIEKR